MLATLVSLSALFVATLFLLIGNGLLGSLLGLKLAFAEAAPISVALLMTGYYGGQLIGAFSGIRIVRRVGHIRAFAAFCAVNVVSTLMIALTDNITSWVLGRLLVGTSMMGAYMVIESWLNERANSRSRGRIFSVYMAISFFGLGGAQFLLGFEDGTNLLIIVSALFFALCMLPVVLTRATVPKPIHSHRFDFRGLVTLAPHAVFACFIAGITNGAFYGLGPVFGYARNGDASFVGIFMGVTIIGGFLLQWPMGALSDRIKRHLILKALGVILVINSLAMLLTVSTYQELLVTLVWGCFAFTIYPVAVAYANDRVGADQVVAVAGVLLVTYSAGAALGPLIAGGVMQVLGADGLYWLIASNGVWLALFVSHRRGAKYIQVEAQGEFVSVPQTSVVIGQLDPRAEPPESAALDPGVDTGAAAMMANPPADKSVEK